ncbi:hypothetical protein CC78DRAFT_549745 [Lojkania enalia]|uniref:Uncharacterized protein n=1 Tax=Lojkania enalia TaxID=147567 RepID=A0A9P4JW86_9PLEO|nr:hypothetical protein CC78DRAFT_549745 [Didymosphaeria enalia]
MHISPHQSISCEAPNCSRRACQQSSNTSNLLSGTSRHQSFCQPGGDLLPGHRVRELISAIQYQAGVIPKTDKSIEDIEVRVRNELGLKKIASGKVVKMPKLSSRAFQGHEGIDIDEAARESRAEFGTKVGACNAYQGFDMGYSALLIIVPT